MPPLGLLTVAAMLPQGWREHIVDVDLRPLPGEKLASKDTILIGTMIAPRVRNAPMPAMGNETTTNNLAFRPSRARQTPASVLAP